MALTLCSLPPSYEHLVITLLDEKDKIEREDVTSLILSNKLREKGKHDDDQVEGLWHEEEQKIKPPITKANADSSLNQISKLLNVITIIRKGILERIDPSEKGKGKSEMNKKGNIRKNCPKRKG